MNDQEKTKEELLCELAALRGRLQELERSQDTFPKAAWWPSIAANTPILLMLLDRQQRIRFINRTDSGVAKERVLGRRIYEFSPFENQEATRAAIENVFLTGKPCRREGIAMRTDGESHWYESHVGPILEGDEVVAVSVVSINVTDRKKAELERDRAQAMLKAAIECLPFDFYALDADGRCILQNARSREFFGDALGKSAEQVCPDPRELPRWLEGTRRALAGEQLEGETELTIAGDRRYFYSVLAPIRHQDALYGMLGVNVDITRPKLAEEALRQSESRYRTLAESTTDIIYILDETGTLRYANRVAGAYMGVAPDALVGKTQDDLFPPDKAKLHRERIRRTFETGEIGEMEERYRFGPTEVWLNVRSIPIRDEQGRVVAVMGLCRDITRRKQAEESLRRANDELETKVRERTAQLTAANERLQAEVEVRRRAEQALERERQSLWQMLQASDHERQTISYEIHDGLAQYLSSAWMQFQAYKALRDDSPEAATKAHDTAIELVRQSHREARRLISAVRPPVIDETGIETAISHLVHNHRRRGGPKIEYRSNVQVGRMPSILENALYRIAQEALTNACRHSRSKCIEISLVQQGQEICLEVRDRGVGFDPQAVQQGHFGLEGIRQRARLLGGKLKIDTAPGAGTSVQIIVPVVERQAES